MNNHPDYVSVRHATRNENGKEELELIRRLTLIEWLGAVITSFSFDVPAATTEVYELVDGFWQDKVTGDLVERDMQAELHYQKTFMAAVRRHMSE
jgi:hypothetical protein